MHFSKSTQAHDHTAQNTLSYKVKFVFCSFLFLLWEVLGGIHRIGHWAVKTCFVYSQVIYELLFKVSIGVIKMFPCYKYCLCHVLFVEARGGNITIKWCVCVH